MTEYQDLDEFNEKKKRVPLSTVEEARKYMAKKIRAFENDAEAGKKSAEYRTFGFLMGKLLDYFRVEKEFDIEKEIEEIRKIINEKLSGKG